MKKIRCILLALIIAALFLVPVSAETGVINALDYGFNNNGTVLNDKIMEKYIRDDSGTPIYFPSGTCLLYTSPSPRDTT